MNAKKARKLRQLVRAEIDGSTTPWFTEYTEETEKRTNSKTYFKAVSKILILPNVAELLKDFKITSPLILGQPSGKSLYRKYKKLS